MDDNTSQDSSEATVTGNNVMFDGGDGDYAVRAHDVKSGIFNLGTNGTFAGGNLTDVNIQTGRKSENNTITLANAHGAFIKARGTTTVTLADDGSYTDSVSDVNSASAPDHRAFKQYNREVTINSRNEGVDGSTLVNVTDGTQRATLIGTKNDTVAFTSYNNPDVSVVATQHGYALNTPQGNVITAQGDKEGMPALTVDGQSVELKQGAKPGTQLYHHQALAAVAGLNSQQMVSTMQTPATGPTSANAVPVNQTGNSGIVPGGK